MRQSVALEKKPDRRKPQLPSVISHCILGNYFYSQAMKKIMLWTVAAIAPVFLVETVVAQETKSAAAAEKTVEAKKPTLTYYYFDG